MRRRLGWIAAIVVVVIAVLIGTQSKDIPSGTGYAAWDLCSRVLQTGTPFDQVRTRYVEPKMRQLPMIWQLDVERGEAGNEREASNERDAPQVTVSTWLPGLSHPRTAVHRKGLGCTVATPGVEPSQLRAQPFVAAPELPADPRPWPFGEAVVESALLDAPARALIDRHAKLIFGEAHQDPKKHLNATALLVARDGHLIYERYGQGHTREQAQLGWSMTKTLTAIIAGILYADGKLAIDAPVGLPQWKGTPKAAITWRQLLNMAPGLAWFEGYGGASDATQMLFSQADQGAWAADRPLTSKPGTVFNYSTGFTNIAMLRMRQLLGGTHQALYDTYQHRLFVPLGIRHGVIEPDASGTPVGGARGMLRPVDWLRLGQLMANGGTWNGTTILPPDYVQFMSAPSPADAGYGGFIWRVDSNRVASHFRARLPKDLIYFAGHMGQFVMVVPSKNLLVLRMGAEHGGTMDNDPAREQALALVADLLSPN